MPVAKSQMAVHPDDRAGRNLETRVWLKLLRLHGDIFERLNRMMGQELDITLAKFDVLAQLERFPEGLTHGSLSRLLKVTGGNVTGLVRRLEADGLVSREMSTDDRRMFVIRLTSGGRTVYHRARERHDALLREMFNGLPAPDLEAARQWLERIDEQLRTNRASRRT